MQLELLGGGPVTDDEKSKLDDDVMLDDDEEKSAEEDDVMPLSIDVGLMMSLELSITIPDDVKDGRLLGEMIDVEEPMKKLLLVVGKDVDEPMKKLLLVVGKDVDEPMKKLLLVVGKDVEEPMKKLLLVVGKDVDEDARLDDEERTSDEDEVIGPLLLLSSAIDVDDATLLVPDETGDADVPMDTVPELAPACALESLLAPPGPLAPELPSPVSSMPADFTQCFAARSHSAHDGQSRSFLHAVSSASSTEAGLSGPHAASPMTTGMASSSEVFTVRIRSPRRWRRVPPR